MNEEMDHGRIEKRLIAEGQQLELEQAAGHRNFASERGLKLELDLNSLRSIHLRLHFGEGRKQSQFVTLDLYYVFYVLVFNFIYFTSPCHITLSHASKLYSDTCHSAQH